MGSRGGITPAELSTFWSRLGRLVRHSGAGPIDRAAHRACPSWVRDRDAAFHAPRKQTLLTLDQFDARQLAVTAHGIASAGIRSEYPWIPFWNGLELAAGARLDTCNAQDMSQLAWALAVGEHRAPALFDAIAATSAAQIRYAAVRRRYEASRFAARRFEAPVLAPLPTEPTADFTPQRLSTLAWAFAHASHPAPALFHAIEPVSVSRMASFEPQSMANLAWSYASTRVDAAALWRPLERNARRRLRGFDDQGLVNLAWSFATAGVATRGLMRDIGVEIGRRGVGRLSNQGLSTLAWAYAVADTPSDDLFGPGAKFAQVCGSRHWCSEGLRQLYQWHLWRAERSLTHWPALPPKLRNACKDRFATSRVQTSRWQRQVGATLSELGLQCTLEVRSSEGYSIDVVVTSPPTEATGGEEQRVAIEVDGPSHYIANGKPTGATLLKRRQLRNFGWKVVSLPHSEWEALRHPNAAVQRRRERRYLTDALRNVE